MRIPLSARIGLALTGTFLFVAIFAQWLGKLGRPSGLLAAMYLLNSIPD